MAFNELLKAFVVSEIFFHCFQIQLIRFQVFPFFNEIKVEITLVFHFR